MNIECPKTRPFTFLFSVKIIFVLSCQYHLGIFIDIALDLEISWGTANIFVRFQIFFVYRLRVRTNREREELRGTVTAMKTTATAPTVIIMPSATCSCCPTSLASFPSSQNSSRWNSGGSGAEAHAIYSSILMWCKLVLGLAIGSQYLWGMSGLRSLFGQASPNFCF